MTPHRLVQQIRLAALLVTALGVWLALGPFRLEAPLDKLAHAGCFYAYTLLALAALPWNRKEEVALAAIGIGIASEIAQGLCGRDASFADLAADTAGVVLAVVPLWVARLRHLAQRRPFVPFDARAPERRRRREAPRPASEGGLLA